MPEHFDLVVIGSGPAGAKGAATAARLGKSVALIERAPHLGGVGLNTGTVPSKTLRETAQFIAGLRTRDIFSIDSRLKPGVSIGDLMYRRQVVMQSEWGVIRSDVERYNIRVIHGQAALADAHTVRVQSAGSAAIDLRADVILVATGSSPRPAPIQHPLVYGTNSLPDMARLPRHLLVVGGGVSGTEYGSMFAALGAQVTVVEAGDRVLAVADPEITGRLVAHLERQEMRFILNTDVAELQPDGDGLRAALTSGEALSVDAVLWATGRHGNGHGLGLEAVGARVNEHGFVWVNDRFQTTVPHVYAVGDVSGNYAYVSYSMEHGRAAVLHAFGVEYTPPNPMAVPIAIYTIPEIAFVGLSEDLCRTRRLAHQIGRAHYTGNPRGQIIGDASGMVKLVFAPGDRKILGAHHIGELASELIHIAAHVIAAGGTLETLAHAVYNYPTLADTYKYAALNGLEQLDRQAARQPADA